VRAAAAACLVVAGKQAAGSRRPSRPPRPPTPAATAVLASTLRPALAPLCAVFSRRCWLSGALGRGLGHPKTHCSRTQSPSGFPVARKPRPPPNTAPSIVPASDHAPMESEGGAVPPPVQPDDFLKDIQAPDLPPAGALPHCRTSCAGPPVPRSDCCGCRPAAQLRRSRDAPWARASCWRAQGAWGSGVQRADCPPPGTDPPVGNPRHSTFRRHLARHCPAAEAVPAPADGVAQVEKVKAQEPQEVGPVLPAHQGRCWLLVAAPADLVLATVGGILQPAVLFAQCTAVPKAFAACTACNLVLAAAGRCGGACTSC
jgi:hypothetical protein